MIVIFKVAEVDDQFFQFTQKIAMTGAENL